MKEEEQSDKEQDVKLRFLILCDPLKHTMGVQECENKY